MTSTMHHLGSTRSASRREYLLHTPDTFVRTPLPGFTGGMATVHAAPQMGAGFAMTTVELEPDGKLTAGPAQRFVYVLGGEVMLSEQRAEQPYILGPGGFAFLAQDHFHTLSARGKARVMMFEKQFRPLEPAQGEEPGGVLPTFLVGQEQHIQPISLNGDDGVQVRSLLPASFAFDFAVNTMTYAPGASLSQVEVHWMEHGLLMLEGSGIYRLGEDWHPVQAGDAIWMGPFCPQWFAAIGRQPAKYLIYKDFNRHVLA